MTVQVRELCEEKQQQQHNLASLSSPSLPHAQRASMATLARTYACSCACLFVVVGFANLHTHTQTLSLSLAHTHTHTHSTALATSDIKWLGVRPSDLDKYNIPQQCRLPMTKEDIAMGKSLLQADFIKKNPAWVKELEMMQKTGEKAEIQALSSFGFQYLTQTYLPAKIRAGDWI